MPWKSKTIKNIKIIVPPFWMVKTSLLKIKVFFGEDLFFLERPTPPALENTVKTMLWSNPHKIGNIYYERIFVLFDQATI